MGIKTLPVGLMQEPTKKGFITFLITQSFFLKRDGSIGTVLQKVPSTNACMQSEYGINKSLIKSLEFPQRLLKRDGIDLRTARTRQNATKGRLIGIAQILDMNCMYNEKDAHVKTRTVEFYETDDPGRLLMYKCRKKRYPIGETIPSFNIADLNYQYIGVEVEMAQSRSGTSPKFGKILSPKVEEETDLVTDILTQAGLKDQAARRRVTEVIIGAGRQMSRVEVVKALEGEYSESTVRRHLKTLEVSGVFKVNNQAGKSADLSILGLDEALASKYNARIKELCEEKGWAYKSAQ